MMSMSEFQSTRRRHRGIAYLLALVLLALCTSLAVAMSASTNLNLRRGDNLHAAMNAQLAAESGLAFAVGAMDGIQSAPYWDESATDMMPVVYAALQAKLGQTPNLDGQSLPDPIDSDGDGMTDTIWTQSIALPGSGGTFSFRIDVTHRDSETSLPTRMQLVVTGTADGATRMVAVAYQFAEDTRVLKYSVASRPRMIITGESEIQGDVVSTWTRTRIGWYDVPPFVLEPDSKVHGKLCTVLSREEFDEHESDSAIQGEHDGIEYDEPSFSAYGVDDFDTSSYRNAAGNSLPDPDYTDWRWFPDSTTKTRQFNRNVYENKTLNNVYIPAGTNPHFKNCTFTGVLYVESNETKTLNDWGYSAVISHYFWQKDRSNDQSNNAVFEDCTFQGKIVTAVPREFWYTKNALTFIGDTVFDIPSGTDTTILAPNFNVNIGDFNDGDSESTVEGILVGGIVDVRDDAEINGTILSMADLKDSLGTSIRYYGTNIGYYEGDAEGGVPQVTSHIRITPQPENPLPLGIRKRTIANMVRNSYTEVAP